MEEVVLPCRSKTEKTITFIAPPLRESGKGTNPKISIFDSGHITLYISYVKDTPQPCHSKAIDLPIFGGKKMTSGHTLDH